MPGRSPLGATAVVLMERARDAGGRGLVHVTTSEGRARRLAAILSALAPDLAPMVFPPWDSLPYDRAAPSREAMGQRMAVLRRLAERGGRAVVVTTPDALLQRVPPPEALRSFALCEGDRLDHERLRAFCRGAGYVEDERVDEPGEVAFRGEVIDVFPAAGPAPFRVEVIDGAITSIRRYDPATQRTDGSTETLVVDPATEFAPPAADEDRGEAPQRPRPHENLRIFLDCLPAAAITADPGADDRREAVLAHIREAYEDRRRLDGRDGRATPPPDRLYLDEREWQDAVSGRIETLETGTRFRPVPSFAQQSRPGAALARFLREAVAPETRLVVAAADPAYRARIAGRAGRATGREPAEAACWSDALGQKPAGLAALPADLDRGFVDAETNVVVIAAADVLGSRAAAGPAQPGVQPSWESELSEIHPGDRVVHLDHGVAVLRGLEPLGPDGADGEVISLDYADGTRLMVPVEEADRIWRYGSEAAPVALDRLHTDAWARRRGKLAAALDETARTLVARERERRAEGAEKLAPPARDYERFVARFPHALTADQNRAVTAVLDDLASGSPMNRLVVGDVGFGKTEVALRAAAAAVFAGRQVAVAVPTTVLARQHVETFARRFSPFGIEVAHLSRLVSRKEAAATRAGLADGTIRVVVGTHALAGKGVAFADLGLLVLDEEQRFGAAQKKKLRDLAAGRHVLTLTATPIPRTLQGALAGLQDMSPIATPPARRRPVRTFATPFDAATVCSALRREKRRGGQSFVVVPRIEDIEPLAAELARLAPELDLRIAHGELPAAEVDETMIRFAAHEADVLLATSIIESGLDVPRANTMVVHRADLFGMAELHQLRGRVGRSHVQALCYLMTEPGQDLSDATVRRLGTLQAYDRLGAGMAIAARDLDQRGAGELLGERQAGHVSLVGLTLYQHLLARALREARGEPAGDRRTELHLELSPMIPPDYIPEPEIRLNLYHRTARAAEPADVDGLAAEIADRFGPPPPAVRDLLEIAAIRTLAASLGVAKLTAGPQAVALAFHAGIDPEEEFAEQAAQDPDLDFGAGKLLCRRTAEDPRERLGLVADLLAELS